MLPLSSLDALLGMSDARIQAMLVCPGPSPQNMLDLFAWFPRLR